MGKVVKTLAVKKNWRVALREQDRIVKYIVNSTKRTSMNFIVTRPSSDCMIWDRPSRRKLAASKSVRKQGLPMDAFMPNNVSPNHSSLSSSPQQPGPFPITNIDLAEFTLGVLRKEKLYNTCPYVVQDGI